MHGEVRGYEFEIIGAAGAHQNTVCAHGIRLDPEDT